MITSARIGAQRTLGGPDWITSLHAPAMRSLAQAGSLQLGLFDETSLATISHPDYPGERLIACRNPALAQERTRKRNELIEATRSALASLSASVAAKGNLDVTTIARRVQRVINGYKVAKQFVTEISEGRFGFHLDGASVRGNGGPGRDLCHPHLGRGVLPERGPGGRGLQGPGGGREGLPQLGSHRPRAAPGLPLDRRRGARPRLCLHVGRLSQLAPAKGAGAPHLHRRGDPQP